ncbi:unnamed protein product [Chironomus riparius]|uniref:Uncharacterized protein n=1 Tax=Chironomus riparius TaxID=315576 RepID=A0A9N9RLG1_9DIPT|nr:unnamed protein product [Chironomus riparius]
MNLKIGQLILIISFITTQSYGDVPKCEDEGCYEVIKTFVKLLEDKINETDKILAEAEKELSEVTHGSDGNFQNRILELESRLDKLIIEMITGIDGGEHSLFELINIVFKSVDQIDANTNQIELSLDDGNKLVKIADVKFTDIKEAIRKVQEEFEKVKNQTDTDLPNALQDAFDKSEKFHTDTKELKEIVEKMKRMLADYEKNLMNAKDLISQTLDKFSEISNQIDSNSEILKWIQDTLKEATDSPLPVHELENVKKLTSEAMEKAKSVFDDSLELLNEVSLLELYGKFDDIKSRIKELNDYPITAEADLKKFSDDNSQFLEEMETTIEKAEKLEKKSETQQDKIKELLKEVKDIEKMSKKAIEDKDGIINNARNIFGTLEDFNTKVEESRENARAALEKIPEILKKISDSKEIVKTLENEVEENMKVAQDAKDKNTVIKEEMDKVLEQSSNMKTNTEALADELDEAFDAMTNVQKIHEKNSKDHDGLKKAENETEDFVQKAKEKVDRTKTKREEVDGKVDTTIDDLEKMMKQIDGIKDVDLKQLEEFETKITEIEGDLNESKLAQKYEDMKAQRQQQEETIENYKVHIAFLEHEVKTIKENAESLENRCFKRTRLEP